MIVQSDVNEDVPYSLTKVDRHSLTLSLADEDDEKVDDNDDDDNDNDDDDDEKKKNEKKKKHGKRKGSRPERFLR